MPVEATLVVFQRFQNFSRIQYFDTVLTVSCLPIWKKIGGILNNAVCMYECALKDSKLCWLIAKKYRVVWIKLTISPLNCSGGGDNELG